MILMKMLMFWKILSIFTSIKTSADGLSGWPWNRDTGRSVSNFRVEAIEDSIDEAMKNKIMDLLKDVEKYELLPL